MLTSRSKHCKILWELNTIFNWENFVSVLAESKRDSVELSEVIM